MKNQKYRFNAALVLLSAIFLAVLALATRAEAGGECCNITAINAKSGLVTAKDSKSGKVFQFKVGNAKQLMTLKIGQKVSADFKTGKVAVYGGKSCCEIVQATPCVKQPLKSPGVRLNPCAKEAETPSDTLPEPDYGGGPPSETGAAGTLPEPDYGGGSPGGTGPDSGLGGGLYGEPASREPKAPVDLNELTGKIPGMNPPGGNESGASEGPSIQGDRPWYDKLGGAGGRRPANENNPANENSPANENGPTNENSNENNDEEE